MPNLEKIRTALSKSKPVTVRRVLPRDFIEAYIGQYMAYMEVMMKSFHAILTFPTTGRELPRQAMEQMRDNLCRVLRASASKIKGEVDDLLKLLQQGKILQSNIMLNVLSDTPFPYCLLNTVEYQLDATHFIPCYVILWAQHETDDHPIKVWAQLAPRLEEHWDMLDFERLASEPHYIRLPTGQAEFEAFNTYISVTLHDVPTEAEATLTGKSLPALLKELRDLRHSLVRNKNQRGNFLHLMWARHHTSRYVPVEEFDLDKARAWGERIE